MKISYNWLKAYCPINILPEEVAKLLTDCGLEVEAIESFQAVKGGLQGVVVGHIKSCARHPNADRLSITQVDIGGSGLVQIVCGAPNVAAGQKVLVAKVGSTLYPNDGDPFNIQKSKIRGEVSEGMICAEDEIGIGHSHEGILILGDNAQVGQEAADYLKIANDTVFEIGLTPNRIDAASHIGVAIDLIACLHQKGLLKKDALQRPSVDTFANTKDKDVVSVVVDDTVACPRYSGVTIKNVKVQDSPEWLQNYLKAIGVKPINNIVDISNFVLHETGQPLHIFDIAAISNKEIIVKKLATDTEIETLDGQKRKLLSTDLLIADKNGALCIAGVYGGLHSGVKQETTDIFIESAYFDPSHIRKTSKHHLLKTDAAYRYERGTDPNGTIYALKRAALLVKEIAGGQICGEIIDIYPEAIHPKVISVNANRINKLIGQEIEIGEIKSILQSLEIAIKGESEKGLLLEIPTRKVDVHCEADIAEEILRIYGLNNIGVSNSFNTAITYTQKPNEEQLKQKLSNYLASVGFNEMMAVSLCKPEYANNDTEGIAVPIVNPLSQDLAIMRQSLLYSALEAVEYNKNRKNSDLKLFELGKSYQVLNEKYHEQQIFSLCVSGKKWPESWNSNKDQVNFFYLKGILESALASLGFVVNQSKTLIETFSNSEYSGGLRYMVKGNCLAQLGQVSKAGLKKVDLKEDVFYAEIYWDQLLKVLAKTEFHFTEISKFPEVRRDLSMVLDKEVSFAKLKEAAFQTERVLLKEVNLFDVYDGDKIEQGKKSYALSFILADDEKTLTDKAIDKTMERIMSVFEKQFAAQIRK